MGIFKKEKDIIFEIQKNFYKEKFGKEVKDLRPKSEKRMAIRAQKPLNQNDEDYAELILKTFKISDSGKREKKLRNIGMKLNDHDKMIQIALRAQFLAFQRNIKAFSIRIIEYAWDGIAGWER